MRKRASLILPGIKRKSVRRVSNSGTCDECGTEYRWRSVSDRCWRCEANHLRGKVPFYIEREILVSTRSARE